MGIPFLSIDINTELLVVILIISCFLLVSNIKLESFKKSSEKTGKNVFYVVITVLLTFTTLTLFLLNYSLLNLISLSVVIYLFSSLIFNFYKSF
jgi:phosphatidylserine synthase